MKELKDWVIDQLTYWNNYCPMCVCYGPSIYEVDANKKVLTTVLEKIREIEKRNEQPLKNCKIVPELPKE